uniref:Pseudouridine synthase RsuA/RluA-like domain-containing protein n=1 Tax=Globisporangium ultimum (strain ATCC 200006 / CBS 805.95 / DAOM BR144) TaxID=431595 RepID=K3WJW7_GLOUD
MVDEVDVATSAALNDDAQSAQIEAPAADAVVEAAAASEAANGGDNLSKRQRKKQQRALAAEEHQANKKKAKREHKQANRFQTPVAEYSFANGYRMVKPYVYEFRTYAKERWYDHDVLSVFTKEFGANSPEYYKFALQSGRISVNHTIVAPDTILKNGDLIIHKAHRHEPPVSAQEAAFVYEDDDVLVVSKPPSIPTHPCGAYRHNSLHSIVQHARPDLPQLNIVHRLDRLTSGIVLFAKTVAKAKSLSSCIVKSMCDVLLSASNNAIEWNSLVADRQVSKTYLARGRGHFPTALTDEFKQKLIEDAKARCSASEITFTNENQIRISCPLRCLSARDAMWECHEDGKPSETLVSLVRHGNSTSLLKCKPITGRTHQIRLHLQLIGFPIANDPCYGGELHFGESKERLEEIAKAKQRKNELPPKQEVDFSMPQQPDESEDEFMKRTCSWCYIGADEAFNETQLHCSKIWLHALEYKLDGHVFQVPEPSWASPSDEY